MGTGSRPTTMESLTDAQLVQRVLAADETAVRALVGRFERQVFALCYRMLGHRQDAEDAAQESFVRVLRSMHRWDRHRPLRPWVLTIAANRCRTILTQRARYSGLPLLEHQVIDARQAAANADLAEELNKAIRQLPLNHRMAFTLFHEQALSCAEVATVMDVPLGTAKVWLHRARHRLAEDLRSRGIVPNVRLAMQRV